MLINKKAFTFVELIVVLVIITILSTIWYVVYESYLSTGRDTVKIAKLKDIYTSAWVYALKSRIPFPENKVDISASGSVFAYQWDFTQEIAKNIWFKWDPYDSNLEIYPVYMLSDNRKDIQLLDYIEDPNSLAHIYMSETHALADYDLLTPKVLWKPLWVLVDKDDRTPLHKIQWVPTIYDIVNGTGSLQAYYSQLEYFDNNLSRIIPDKSCKRILDLGWAQGSGIYTINPTGARKIKVYCDMQTDWGGWTFFWFYDWASNSTNTLNFLNGEIWIYSTNRDDNNVSYSIDISDFSHTEMMVSLDNKSIEKAWDENKLLFLSFPLGHSWFSNGPIPCTWLSSGSFQYKFLPFEEYINGTSNVCDATRWYLRDQNSSWYLTLFHATVSGNYWWTWMWWNNTWWHDGWWYIR